MINRIIDHYNDFIMAGKSTPMSKIKQLIRLHLEGKKKKQIARIVGISLNTVKGYLRKIAVSSYDFETLLKMEDLVLEQKFQAGTPAYSAPELAYLNTQMEYYVAELRGIGVTRKLLWEEYQQSRPNGYKYAQFCYHLNQYQLAKKPSMVLKHQAADKLYIDFSGHKAHYVDLSTGERIDCELFVASLPYSDYGFTIAVPSQKVEDFIYALVQSLQFFGGVPAAIVSDNLKTAIVKSSRYEPLIQETLAQLANHYGTTILPTRVYKPKDKALVENHVKLVYQRLLAPLRHQQFFSLNELNTALAQMNQRLNQTRMQTKDYTREEKFISSECSLLRPLPETPFCIQYQQIATVQKNGHVILSQDKHYYSVPFIHINQRAKILYTATQVTIWVKGEQVAVHQRSRLSKHAYTTTKDHLCSAHQHYLDRSPDYYIQQAKQRSEVLSQLVTLLFTRKTHPEQLYKTCDGLFRLHRSYAIDKFNQACSLAIECQQYNYTFVRNVLENNMTADPLTTSTPQVLPVHPNVRGCEYYNQLTLNLEQ